MTMPPSAPQAFWGWIDHTLTGGSGVGPIATSRGWPPVDFTWTFADTRDGIGPEVASSRARSVVVTPEGRTLALYRTSDDVARAGGEFIHVIDVSGAVSAGNWDPLVVASRTWFAGLFLKRTEAMQVINRAPARNALNDLALTNDRLIPRADDENLVSVRQNPPFNHVQLTTILSVVLARLNDAASVPTACAVVPDRASTVPHLVQVLDRLPVGLRAHVTFTTELRAWRDDRPSLTFGLAPGRAPAGAPAPVVDLVGGTTREPKLPGWTQRMALALVSADPEALPHCPGSDAHVSLRALWRWVLAREIETTPPDSWSAEHLRIALRDAPATAPAPAPADGARRSPNAYWSMPVVERVHLVERLVRHGDDDRDLLALARNSDPEVDAELLRREVSSGGIPLNLLSTYLRIEESSAGPDELQRLIAAAGARVGRPAFSPDDASVLAAWIERCMQAAGIPDEDVVMDLADRDHVALLTHLPEDRILSLAADAALDARADGLVEAVLANPRSGPALVSRLALAGGPSTRVSVELARRLDADGLRTVASAIVDGSADGLQSLWLWCDDLIVVVGKESFVHLFAQIAREYLAMTPRCVEALVPHMSSGPGHLEDRGHPDPRHAEERTSVGDTLTLPPRPHDEPGPDRDRRRRWNLPWGRADR
ncbi:hypothetical protein OVA21_13790 [Dietzia sp. SL131]|uniref:hypothetical protein n=1 Tax=Dietzia sp. SL131 TaxID=2995149 RepID=UPI00227AB4D0|nr:hypothetical protein [Dietzia sp. SL131]MCY1658257.1 hypothetical protein [Dietzia sp. SL131]